MKHPAPVTTRTIYTPDVQRYMYEHADVEVYAEEVMAALRLDRQQVARAWRKIVDDGMANGKLAILSSGRVAIYHRTRSISNGHGPAASTAQLAADAALGTVPPVQFEDLFNHALDYPASHGRETAPKPADPKPAPQFSDVYWLNDNVFLAKIKTGGHVRVTIEDFQP